MRGLMKSPFADLRFPAIISSLFVLPLMILEFLFQLLPKWNILGLKTVLDLVVLFGSLWLLPLIFMVLLTLTLRHLRIENGLSVYPVQLVMSVAILILTALIWGAILVDQWPCFIGIPNCD